MKSSSSARFSLHSQNESTELHTESLLSIPELGRTARKKKRCYSLDALIFGVSCLCAATATTVANPKLSLAWQLGCGPYAPLNYVLFRACQANRYINQITVIGFALSIQSLCTSVLTRKLFMVVEARHGKSILQNFDAILTNSPFAHNASYVWRITIIFFMMLPIALSVAYKQFAGGSSTNGVDHSYTDAFDHTYGVNGLPGTTNFGNQVGLSVMSNISLPFLTATNNDSLSPNDIRFPQPFGFNVLMLSNSSVAALDAPAPTYVEQIRPLLSRHKSEIWRISATVNATVARYNTTLDQERNNANFWDTMPPTNAPSLAYQDSKDYHYVALDTWYALDSNPSDRTDCLLAMIPYPKEQQTEEALFRNMSKLFTIRREFCNGTWEVTPASVELVSGQCSGSPTAFGTVGASWSGHHIQDFYMPTLLEYLGAFGPTRPRNSSAWEIPTFTAISATMFWSRVAGMQRLHQDDNVNKAAQYTVADRIISARATMSVSGVLYMILLLHPVMGLSAWVALMLFSDTPITGGFNIVALLSGIDVETLPLLRGAGFSGKLLKQVRMRIAVQHQHNANGNDAVLSYRLGSSAPNDRLRGSQRLAKLH